MKIEWASVRHAETEYVRGPGELRDARGLGNAGPALLIASGDGGGIVIEAKYPIELVVWLRMLADEIDEADDEEWRGGT